MPLQQSPPSSRTLHFLKHVYDPSNDDIRRLFPDYQPWTQAQWLAEYTQHGDPNGSPRIAAFALRKLDAVTTSYRLSAGQRADLQRLSRNEPTDEGFSGYEGYCRTLRARQLDYVGW